MIRSKTGFHKRKWKSNSNRVLPARRRLRGKSILYYTNMKTNDINNLLGKRFLPRKGGMLLVAPSGVGKSTMVVQMTICFSIGKDCVHIKPNGELKVLYVQAEDYEDDLTEMAQ